MAVMEVTRLRVAPENEAALRAAREGMLDAFATRRGFVSAELVRMPNGDWLDLIVWDTSEDLAESRRRGGDVDAVRAFFAAIDEVVSSDEGELWVTEP